MDVKVYGIPNCDSVKKARRWLDDKNVPYSFIDFRATPVGAERIASWVSALGSKAMRNTSGRSYRALPEGKKSWNEPVWIEHFTQDPMLLKRPVIEVGDRAVQAGFRTADALQSALDDGPS